ncbi:hypothetical protein Cob_v006284 [Colletotrichum orbiculare MAFF 240422]|uniref:Uncharacterized protein n=1 Tax=Colletotrichum orbiculare (strain 104-T / ATCC 96160 / CBS 514.97 / LARS 414 / MAFF 240422) TaxID=1213857 RepID=A0A484FSA8_COLOR|nr:hypothetical protein Cob_v006284 [Colletotrichum orbiculare MAFF 240422]
MEVRRCASSTLRIQVLDTISRELSLNRSPPPKSFATFLHPSQRNNVPSISSPFDVSYFSRQHCDFFLTVTNSSSGVSRLLDSA